MKLMGKTIRGWWSKTDMKNTLGIYINEKKVMCYCYSIAKQMNIPETMLYLILL